LKPIGRRDTKRVKARSCRSRAAGKDVIPRRTRRVEGYGEDPKQNDILRNGDLCRVLQKTLKEVGSKQ